VAEDEKVRQQKADELLRTGRLVFLQTAGYTTAEIAGFGDLTKLPSGTMGELLHNKSVNAIANLLGEGLKKERGLRVRKMRRRGQKKRR
jgi:hypothetical protein